MDRPEPAPDVLLRAIDAVEAPDPTWAERVAAHQARLTMPAGALGRLLEIGRRLGAVQRTDRPETRPALVAIFAADHGVAAEGVSAYPQSVTGQMVANFAAGGAAINVLTRLCGASLKVVDVGVAHPPLTHARRRSFFTRSIRPGTSSFARGPAMTRAEAFRAVSEGLQIGSGWVGPERARVIALGEMGIGNTTSAAALAAILLDVPAEDVVGRGTGLDDEALARKRQVVSRAVEIHASQCLDDWDRIARVGGFEILALAGVAIAAAKSRVPVLLDGFISTVAGLVADRLCPAIRGSFFSAHLGPEPGHRVVLDFLGLEPILQLGLRLGEGTGAALALPILDASAAILREMATFDSAGVSGPA